MIAYAPDDGRLLDNDILRDECYRSSSARPDCDDGCVTNDRDKFRLNLARR